MSESERDFDALWDFHNPAETERRFRDLLARQQHPADGPYLAEVRTQIARTCSLQGRFDEAHAMLDAVQRDLESSGDGPGGRGWVRLHLERGRTFNSSGNPGPALVEFDHAWTLARESGEDALAIDAAHMLAIATRGDHAASMHWNVVALQLAEGSCSPRAHRWQASLHNNIGWSHHDAGRFDQALASFQRALELREAQGERREIGIARWCVARCLRSLCRVELALRIQQSLRNQAASGEDAHFGYVEEEIAECLLAMGRHAESRQHYAQAHRILRREPHIDAQRLDRLDRLSRGDAMSS